MIDFFFKPSFNTYQVICLGVLMFLITNDILTFLPLLGLAFFLGIVGGLLDSILRN